ncbi:oligosaccharide flippase family protein [Okeania sp. KiyG1]|uniref:oligosaccharide flippase family protein n=1 Tax=Okeania sp. KiyG1 TaxID=2720165 RepID=UPI0019249871|nr:oligosaccharide flippase family protein [Okeania sp. KiyG1]GGA46170.1 flippase [Okeania sp. KiyG1]
MTQTVSSTTEENLNLGILAKEAGIALVIKFAGILLTYLVQVFLARWIGRTEYGIYEYVVAWSVLLAIPAGLGLPHTVLRFVSQYRVKEEWELLRGIVRSSWLMTILASLLVSLLAAGVILLLNYYHPFAYAIPLLIGIGLIPLQALVKLQLETARAAKDVTLGYAPSQIIWPVLLICGAFLFLETNRALTGISAIAISQITLLAVVLFQLGLLLLKLNQEFVASKPIYAIREWLGVAFVVLLQSGCFLILSKTDTIMVGSILGPSEAGMYAAALKTAKWVGFVPTIINIVAAPSFAALYAKEDIDGLQKVVGTVALWIFWPSLAISLFLILFSQPVLGIFGSEFITANWQLKILVLGRAINSWCGPVSTLMIMTGNQNKSAMVFVYATAINIVLNAIAIPLIGAIGAAMVTTLTFAMWNILLSFLVVKYVGVSPLVFRGLFQRDSSKSEIGT